MKKVEEKNENNKKRDTKIYKSNTVKKIPKSKNNNNLFNFSETAKNLMAHADIEVSSINDDNATAINMNQIKRFETTCKKEINNKNNIFIKKNKNDSNKSLLSLISDLIIK